ncbi:MAG TPA: hypothetical protein VI548_13790 [Chitinophagaceae bacterium]|nr:hypothetical protein [Chitinophagaceae bacterium]
MCHSLVHLYRHSAFQDLYFDEYNFFEVQDPIAIGCNLFSVAVATVA